MLAFPAVLAASLTLIADEETRRAAREDARGAVVGAVALGEFALVCDFGFRHLNPVLVLVLAMLAWISAACGLYLLLWAPSRACSASARGARRGDVSPAGTLRLALRRKCLEA